MWNMYGCVYEFIWIQITQLKMAWVLAYMDYEMKNNHLFIYFISIDGYEYMHLQDIECDLIGYQTSWKINNVGQISNIFIKGCENGIETYYRSQIHVLSTSFPWKLLTEWFLQYNENYRAYSSIKAFPIPTSSFSQLYPLV